MILLFFFFSLLPLKAESVLRLSETEWNFGEIAQTYVQEKTLSVRNDGTSLLKVEFRSSCPCLSVFPGRLSLSAGEKGEVTISLDPEGEEGAFSKTVFIQSNAPDFPVVEFFAEGTVKREVALEYFYDPGCKECIVLRKEIIGILAASPYEGALADFYITEKDTFTYFLSREKNVTGKVGEFPVIFLGDRFLSGKERIKEDLPALLREYRPVLPVTREKGSSGLSLIPVIAAALIDGINPCAFAAMIFLISYLSMIAKKGRRKVFLAGILFSSGVFVFYFLTGLGLFAFLKALAAFRVAGILFYLLFGIGTMILSVFSFIDAVNIAAIRRGETRKVYLKVPAEWRWKFSLITEKLYRKPETFLAVSFFLGGAISLFEFICTGQIYLPTISYIISLPQARAQGIFYLFVYSLFFVLPLLLVFLLVYLGIHSEKIDAFFQERVTAVKILTGLLFLFFSVYLIYNFWIVWRAI